jgi:hypothetical protein
MNIDNFIVLHKLKTIEFSDKLKRFFKQNLWTLYDLNNIDIEQSIEIKNHYKKDLLEFKKYVNLKHQEIIDDFKLRNTEIILPIDATIHQNSFSLFEQIVNEVIAIYRKRSEDRSVEMLYKYFEIEADVNQIIKEIAFFYKLKRQRVEQILYNEIGLRKLFLGDVVNNIKIDPDALRILGSVFDQKYKLYNALINDAYEQNWNFSKLERVLNLFGKTLYESPNNQFVIIPSSQKGRFDSDYTKFVQLLKRNAIPASINTIGIELSLINLFIQIGEYEFFFEDGSYFMHWAQLSSPENRLKRIIWESNTMISKEELIEEYNRRVDLYNKYKLSHITDEDFRLKQCANFKAQKNGFWEYRTARKLTLQEFIAAIFSEVNQISFTEVKKMVSEAGYKYPEKTIRNYILEHAYAISKKNDLFIRIDELIDGKPKRQYGISNIFIKQVFAILKDLQYTEEDLLDMVIEKINEMGFQLKPNIAKQYLKKYSEHPYKFWFNQKNIKGENVWLLNHNIIERVVLETIGLKEEKAYISNLKSLIINYLRGVPNGKEKRSVLKKNFEDRMPSDIKTNNFYKILNKIKDIEIADNDYVALKTISKDDKINAHQNLELKYRKSFVWSDLKDRLTMELVKYPMDKHMIAVGLEDLFLKLNPHPELGLKRLLQYMYDIFFCQNDHYDRDSIFLWLVISYESFLRIFNKEYEESKDGLYKLIESIDLLNDIHKYKFDSKNIPSFEIDKTKLSFSFHINSLLYFRNLYTHDMNLVASKLKTEKQMKYILDFMALYVYSCYILKK